MSRCFLPGWLVLVIGTVAAAEPAAPPTSKIKPGEAIIPVGKGEQRLILGELVSLDLKNRTGTFRFEHNDMLAPFTVLPYAVLMHHAASGDLQDFRIGERCLFRLHQDTEGKWTWLTYIGDEMAYLATHDSFLWVDALDPAKREITISRGNAAKTQWGEKGVVLTTDADTHYWQFGKPAAFENIKVGARLRTRTHGVGKGQTRVCWDVFLDDESFQKFREEQKAVHAKRMELEGVTGYVDVQDGKQIRLTMFIETQLGQERFIDLEECARGWGQLHDDRRQEFLPLPGTTEQGVAAWNANCVGQRGALDNPPWAEFKNERNTRFEFGTYEGLYEQLLRPLKRVGWHTFDAN